MKKDPIDIRKEEILEERKQNGGKSGNKDIFFLVGIVIFIFISLILLFKFGSSMVQNEMEEQENREELSYQELVNSFVSGDNVTYMITNKTMHRNFTIVNKETKDVFYIDATDAMYYQMAEGQEFNAINSKDNTSMKMVDTGEYFTLDKIEYEK